MTTNKTMGKKKYHFEAYWRAKWGDDYGKKKISVQAKNFKEAVEKAFETYKDVHTLLIINDN